MNKESARGVTLVICSHVDMLLERIIRAFLLAGDETDQLLTGFNAPLGSLSARATGARALALITSAEFQEINTLRKIRNEFAHQVHCTFADPKVVKLCARLKLSASELEGETLDEPIARAAFTSAGICLIANLTNREAYVSRQQLSDRGWPY